MCLSRGLSMSMIKRLGRWSSDVALNYAVLTADVVARVWRSFGDIGGAAAWAVVDNHGRIAARARSGAVGSIASAEAEYAPVVPRVVDVAGRAAAPRLRPRNPSPKREPARSTDIPADGAALEEACAKCGRWLATRPHLQCRARGCRYGVCKVPCAPSGRKYIWCATHSRVRASLEVDPALVPSTMAGGPVSPRMSAMRARKASNDALEQNAATAARLLHLS
jgi:hypothetical protein